MSIAAKLFSYGTVFLSFYPNEKNKARGQPASAKSTGLSLVAVIDLFAIDA
jgi:hypothetical protein